MFAAQRDNVRAVKLNSQVDRLMLNAWEPGEHLARKTANWTVGKRDTFDAKYDERIEGGEGYVRDTIYCLSFECRSRQRCSLVRESQRRRIARVVRDRPVQVGRPNF